MATQVLTLVGQTLHIFLAVDGEYLIWGPAKKGPKSPFFLGGVGSTPEILQARENETAYVYEKFDKFQLHAALNNFV